MKKLNFLLALALMFFCQNINAQIETDSPVFDGSVVLDIDRHGINLKVENIFNDEDFGRSGTLKLEVWLFKDQFYGKQQVGYLIAEKKYIDQLDSGENTGKMELSFPWKKSFPNGEYYPAVLLLEYDEGEYEMIDWQIFSRKTKINFF